jgi:autotransporter-associated beta strand protein
VVLIDGCLTSTSGVLTSSAIELQNGYSNATLAGSATAYKTTAGAVTLNATSNFTGNMVIADGTVFAQANSSVGTGTVVFGNATTQSSDDLALLLTTSGRNVTNDIIVNNFGNSTTIGSSSPSGTMTYSGNITLNKDVVLTVNSGNLRFLGSINGSANITKTGDGTVFFNGTNDNAMGNVTISAGTLSITNGSAIGDNSTVTVAGGANFAVTANETIGALAGAGNVTLSNSRILVAGGNNQNTTFSGILQGGNGISGLTKEGSGTLILANDNTYAGATTVNSGTLQLGNGANLGSVAGNIVDNANVAFNNGSDQTYAGVISGSGQLTASGTATLTLTGNNTFSGTATVSGGTLALAAAGSNKALGGASTIVITSGGTLLLDASEQTNSSVAMVLSGGTFVLNGQNLSAVGALTLSATSTMDLGGGDSLVAFGDSSAATWTPSQELDITGWTDGDQIYFGTSSTGLTDSQLPQIRFINPFGDGNNWSAGLDADGRLRPVPEPSTIFAGGLLLFLAAFAEWRRRRKK